MSMNVSRRWFIGGAASFGALPGFRLSGADCPTGAPKLAFGIVSDVHVSMSGNGKGIRESHNCDTLVQTLEWFRDQKVDAVMIAGDMADHGMVDEMEAIAAAWFKVFPNDRAPDGRKVERLFVYGNHDWEGFTYGNFAKKAFPDRKEKDASGAEKIIVNSERAKHILRTDYAGNWQRIWHEPFAPVWMKTVKGYSFVGAHWMADCCRGKDEVGMVGVHDFFAANGGKLDPRLPFFYFQHPHPNGTCYGASAWGRDDAVKGVTPVLSKFPNAVAFSGHSHYTLTDERSIWQGAFTSIGTASLRYTSIFGAGGYENYGGSEFMPGESTFNNRQGMLARVYDDHITISRRDFTRQAAMLGGDWVMPLPAAESKPFAFATRAAKLGAPQFATGAKAVAAAAVAKPLEGKRKGQNVEVAQITFPVATGTKSRAFSYLVEHDGADGKMRSHRVLAPGYHRPPTSPEATAPIKYTMAKDGLPKGTEVSFRIFPVSSHGVKGNPLVAKLAL